MTEQDGKCATPSEMSECFEWNKADIVDLAWFDEASCDHDDSIDSLEAYISNFVDEDFFNDSSGDEDDASRYTDNDTTTRASILISLNSLTG